MAIIHLPQRRQYFENRYVLTHVVEPPEHGLRADVYLQNKLRNRSRNFIQKAIENGSVEIHRHPLSDFTLKSSTRLLVGDVISITQYRQRLEEPEVSFDYKTLYEDEDMLVIDKPGNLPVHPAGRFVFNTLLTHLQQTRERPFYLVHRIDRETSGLILLGKSSKAAHGISQQFAKSKVSKRYLAIIYGHAPEKIFSVNTPIGPEKDSLVKLKMTSRAGLEPSQEAFTQFEVLNSGKSHDLIEARPTTGRQHQIRVHLASIGLPLVGDKLYSTAPEIFHNYVTTGIIPDPVRSFLILERHALHASWISLAHPRTGEQLSFNSPAPEDFLTLLENDGMNETI